RVYANYLPLHMGKGGTALHAQTYVLSNTRFIYETDLNGIDPWQFIYFSNNKGFQDQNGKPLFHSIEVSELNSSKAFLHNPGLPDSDDDVTHKMFFNLPSEDLPKDATTPSGQTTWLLSDQPALPKVSNFNFTGSEGTPNQAGTLPEPLGGEFNFDSDSEGIYLLTIDVNGDGIYGNANDRVLIGDAIIGTNNVFWDGLDGNDDGLLPSLNVPYGANLSLIVDDIHFPFLDPEANPNGLIVERIDCDLPPPSCSLVYFNNTEITEVDDQGRPLPGSPQPIAATAGMDSRNGAQKFAAEGAYDGGFGNNKGIDTWTSIAVPKELDGGIRIKKADLTVNKTHNPVDIFPGGEMSYTITVNNGGPSDVTGVTVEDTLPQSITITGWTCQVTPATSGNRCAATTGQNDINTVVDLLNGGSATFTIQGVVSNELKAGDTISNTAIITRPADVTNPSPNQGNVDSEEATDTLTLVESPIQPQPPTADDKTAPSTPNDTPVKVPSLSGTDSDGSVVSYQIETIPPANAGVVYLGDPEAGGQPLVPGQTLTPEEVANLVFKPNPNFTGTTRFMYTAIDNQNLVSEPAQVLLPVTDVDAPPSEPPVASNINAQTPGTPTQIPIIPQISDPDGDIDPESLVVTTPPTHGSTTVNPDGTVTYTPEPGFSGSDEFTYMVCDVAGQCDTGTVSVQVTPPTPTTLTVTIIGQGQVTSPAPTFIACQPDNDPCSDTGTADRKINLTPQAAPGWRFEGWKGDCDSRGQVIMTTDKKCQAIFVEESIPLVELTVDRIGEGTVISQPSGIECGAQGDQCNKTYSNGSEVELIAKPEPGFRFTGWRGDCQGTQNPITVTLNAAKQCTAEFEPIPPGNLALKITKAGRGLVTSEPGDINCGPNCDEDYPEGTTLTLKATPEPGFQFKGWQGDCQGSNASISVTMDAAKNCQAVFEAETVLYPLNTVIKTGAGTITSEVDGLVCDNDCTREYANGTLVQLTATPEAGFKFTGWSGADCDGSQNPTTVTMTAAKACEANFAPVNPGQIEWSTEHIVANEFGNVATITVSRVGGQDGRISVDFNTQEGSAIQGVDYEAISGTLVWEDGDDSDKTITVTIKDDAIAEGDETVNVVLSNPTGGATIATQEPAVLTISDDESTTAGCQSFPSCQSLSPYCCLSCQISCLSCPLASNQLMKIKALAATVQ
ncbi:MAG: Ig-like domain-containing protein, partial [Pseudomonadota bacterium]|nr:Ig-like domain-containing protein [Pseudomonadota bacterium]